jgi:hypothetical protein
MLKLTSHLRPLWSHFHAVETICSSVHFAFQVGSFSANGRSTTNSPGRRSERSAKQRGFIGFVPIEVLRIFLRRSKVFHFPSLYEASLPEVVGRAAMSSTRKMFLK